MLHIKDKNNKRLVIREYLRDILLAEYDEVSLSVEKKIASIVDLILQGKIVLGYDKLKMGLVFMPVKKGVESLSTCRPSEVLLERER